MSKVVTGTSRWGKGAFAKRNLQPGEPILTFSGTLTHRSELPESYGPHNDHYLQVDDELFLGPSGGTDDFVNHSCEPNTGVTSDNGNTRLFALRAIHQGEELFFDYSTTMHDYDWELECSCGSSLCRGKIGDFVSLPLVLQEKYVSLGAIPDYIRRKYLRHRKAYA